jgi:hypothetical protein
MESRAWLRSRRPEPPARLLTRMESALSENSSQSLSDDLIAAATRILREVAHGEGANDRAAALDLLAADALITYSIEAAAEDPKSFAVQTDAMISRVAEIAKS